MSDTDDWRLVKTLWFSVEQAPPAERAELLAAPNVPAHVRDHVERLLDAQSQIGDRFDTPAHVALGFHSAPVADVLATSLVGERLGPYRVIRQVGRGGMGAVYEAQRDDAQYVQRVAIKTLWRGADSDVLLQRFRSERQILAALQHPNIAQLIDGGATATGTPWLAMEFVDGVPIDRYCDDRALSIPARLDLFRQVCIAVHHAHQRLVIHRDLKPSNVLVTDDGTVKLLDFGVAKLLDESDASGTLTGAGLSPFTAAYAAPEQVDSSLTASTSTDVYALGALMVTLLAGAPPLDVEGLDGIGRLLAVREGTPRAPSAVADAQSVSAARARGFDSPVRLAKSLRGELDAIAASALRRDPTRRYASALALADDVRRYLRRDRVLARPDTMRYRAWAFTRRHRALVFGSAAAVLAIAAASIWSLRQARELRAEAARAERAAAFMAAIMSGPAMASQDPMIRIGAVGTMAQLLDSAVLRVPREFANDAGIRARLYTAFGANFSAQHRYAAARRTLDSARALAAEFYGTRSVAYGNASLEWATLELAFNGPEHADPGITAAEQISWPASGSTARARTIVLRARQAISRGQNKLADSLALLLLAPNKGLSVSPTVRLMAEGVRMHTSSWVYRDPRMYLKHARAMQRMTEALGTQLSGERLSADAAEVEALLVLGRAEAAEKQMQQTLDRLRAVIGLQPMLAVEAARLEALLAQVRGDTATRHAALARGWSVLDTLEHFALGARLLFGNAMVDDALSRGDTATARRVSEGARERLRPSRSAITMVFANLYVGIARLASRDFQGAESALREGLEVVRVAPDLWSMGPRLRRPLVEALTAQGRIADADSIRKLDPPKAQMAACTPGGRWSGCPDN